MKEMTNWRVRSDKSDKSSSSVRNRLQAIEVPWEADSRIQRQSDAWPRVVVDRQRGRGRWAREGKMQQSCMVKAKTRELLRPRARNWNLKRQKFSHHLSIITCLIAVNNWQSARLQHTYGTDTTKYRLPARKNLPQIHVIAMHLLVWWVS